MQSCPCSRHAGRMGLKGGYELGFWWMAYLWRTNSDWLAILIEGSPSWNHSLEFKAPLCSVRCTSNQTVTQVLTFVSLHQFLASLVNFSFKDLALFSGSLTTFNLDFPLPSPPLVPPIPLVPNPQNPTFPQKRWKQGSFKFDSSVRVVDTSFTLVRSLTCAIVEDGSRSSRVVMQCLSQSFFHGPSIVMGNHCFPCKQHFGCSQDEHQSRDL